jgi:endonuclease I
MTSHSKNILRSLLAAMTISLAFGDTVAYWNFNSLTNGTNNGASYVANTGSGTLSLTGWNTTSTTGITAFAGTTTNALNSDPAGLALALQGGTTAVNNNGASMVISFSMSGKINPILTFATQRTNTGFNSNQLAYSTDNTSYTNFGATYNPPSVFGTTVQSFDLSSIDALDGAATVYLKITLSGASSTGGNNRIDNILVSAPASGGGDTTAPLASTFTPFDNATGVSLTALPSITFNELIQKGEGNILIKDNGGSTFDTIAVSSEQVAVSGSTVTITPGTAFANSTAYYLEIPSGAIEDMAGNDYSGISGATAWNFTTVAASDLTAPFATTFSPTDDATDVSNTATPSITFNEPIKKGMGNILIKDSGGTTFDTIAVSSTRVAVSGSTVTITPTKAFADSTSYYFEIPSGAIQDSAGNDYNGISGATAWNFTSGITQQAYMAANVTSATGAARPTGGFASADHYAEGSGLGTFAVYSIANFRFNKVDFALPGSASIDNIVSAEYTLTTNNRTFAAGEELEFFLTTDQLNGDFSGKVFNTATVNGINNSNYTFAPVSLGKFPYTPATTPAQGGLPNIFTLNLSAVEPALIAQINAGAEFSIILAATTANAAITYSGKGNTFDPGDPSLKLTVNQTPGTDHAVPLVAAFTPADGFSGFPLSSNLSIRFNELVQKGASGTISIYNSSGNALIEAIDIASSQVTVSNATVTIDPTNPLVSGNTYHVQITAGAIADVSGNDYSGISNTTTWDFTTSQPSITSVGPFSISENAPAGTVVGDLNPSIIGNEGVKYAILGGSGGSTMMKGTPGAGFLVNPIFTIGDTLQSTTGALNASSAGNFSPPGTPDGLGAFSLNATTVRVFMNHEIEIPSNGSGAFPYTLSNGTIISKGGARVTYFDIDKTSRRVVDGGLAIARMYDRAGAVVTNTSQLELGGLDRMCSASLYEPQSFGSGRGLVDRIYLTGEETSTSFGHPHGGTYWALDTSNGDFWALPDFGRGSWENAALVDTGTTTHVAFLLGDDAPGRPLYLYVGQKNSAPSANFIERNGLKGGQLYVWKATNGNTTPQQFNGSGNFRTGTWVAIDAKNAGAANTAGHDSQGYRNDTILKTEADALGAFSFSRPEDLATNPTDGSIVAFASTGRGSIYPLDNWGDTYVLDIDFSASGAPTTGFLRIVYSGDDAGNGQFMTPEEGLRCPDNMEWSDDGCLYIQEDQSNTSGNFNAAGFETSIWRLALSGDLSDSNPVNIVAQATRVAETDRSTALPLGSTDTNAGDFGNWESSGIIDVSTLFGEEAGSLFLFDIQAHSVTTGLIASKNLYEGGQLCFLEKGSEVGAFTINPNSGAITLANPAALHLDSPQLHELRIQSFDGVNSTLEKVTINVTNTIVATTNNFKVATFNTSLYRDSDGALINDLATVTNDQARKLARIIQRNNADIILINEFDYDADGLALRRFKENYLEVAQNGENPVYYPYAFIAPANTGVHSGFDLDNNGSVVSNPGATGYGEDAFGFGTHPGQYAFVVLSKYPIDTPNVRTFQKFLWKDMPGADLPDNPANPAVNDWYSPAELNVFRLSSKNHADVPVLVNGTPVHILASHPTPPVFDSGAPWTAGVDHNGRRNSDEIRFWSDYVNPASSGYIYDDSETFATRSGGLPANTRFIICGDQNADNNEGDSTDPAIKRIIGGNLTIGGAEVLPNPFVNPYEPSGGAGPQPDDTAAFSGGVRVDYTLPSAFGLTVNSGAVFWPAASAGTISDALSASDHHLVYLNLTLSGTTTPPSTGLAAYYSPASGLTGTPLQSALHNIIDGHTVVDYGTVDEVMQVIDAVDSTSVRLIYSLANLPKSSANISGGWNREHVWPRSDGVGDTGPDYSDIHHLFPCKDSVNSLRGNLAFDESANLESDSFAPESFKDNDSWEPLDRDKGIVARAQLYMMTRYDGSDSETVDLLLADNTTPTGTQGMLSTLLAWHRAFPPTDYERNRNNAIYGGVQVGAVTYAQGNRNPFIDIPQLADAMLLGPTASSFEKWQVERFTIAQLLDSAASGTTANLDGDTFNTLQEYGFGLDPNLSDGGALEFSSGILTKRGGPTTWIQHTSNGTNYRVVFIRRKGDPKLSYFPEFSEDLQSWVAGTGAITVVADGGDVEAVSMEYPIFALGKKASFFRVGMSRN